MTGPPMGPRPEAAHPAEEPRIVAMHPALVPAFEGWLASRGLELRRTPLREWIVTPTDESMRTGDWTTLR